ncbi:glycosyltransferase [Flavobacterium sp. MMS24-S5]|uniref:glycosyltransferase n=1 Tax=Flavobacterium sp. MMS24-S5 TaxID=3416605 RepID=UPI003D0477BD
MAKVADRKLLEDYIVTNNLENYVVLKGNQNQEVVTEAYQNSHFVVLPSKSEGWPKVVAEGMFWGCIPIATCVSCVPFMLDYGKRGVLLEMDLELDIKQLEAILNSEMFFDDKGIKASEWSQKYTLNVFEEEIKKLLRE